MTISKTNTVQANFDKESIQENATATTKFVPITNEKGESQLINIDELNVIRKQYAELHQKMVKSEEKFQVNLNVHLTKKELFGNTTSTTGRGISILVESKLRTEEHLLEQLEQELYIEKQLNAFQKEMLFPFDLVHFKQTVEASIEKRKEQLAILQGEKTGSNES